MRVDLIRQRGPYADLTSVLNGARHLQPTRQGLYVAFSDNLYPGGAALAALGGRASRTAVLARPYRRELATSRGVIVADAGRMTPLMEEPGPDLARDFDQRHGPANLLMLEERARLSSDFLTFASRHYRPPAGSELKLSLCLAQYAHGAPVDTLVYDGRVIDLGAPAEHSPAGAPGA
ncbi:transcriptional regulator [Actinomadura fibrosa]|uniref:Transcriptional regulator n=1 Tax=Actinomadura fibrosa TaxID=111802 RepID=A0ABW2Y1H3_9ACTN|nr:transcriptional regulator [Actinomadura fibrosa]